MEILKILKILDSKQLEFNCKNYLFNCFFKAKKTTINILHILFIDPIILLELGIYKSHIDNVINEIKKVVLNYKNFFDAINEYKRFLVIHNNCFNLESFMQSKLSGYDEKVAKELLILLEKNKLVFKNKIDSTYIGHLNIGKNYFFEDDTNEYKNIISFLSFKSQINHVYANVLHDILNSKKINFIENKHNIGRNLILELINSLVASNINCYENKFLSYLKHYKPSKNFWKHNQILSIE